MYLKLEKMYKQIHLAAYLNYYFDFAVCVSFCHSVVPSVQKKFNASTYQKMLLNKIVTILKRIEIAILFFVHQIWPKWIKLDET